MKTIVIAFASILLSIGVYNELQAQNTETMLDKKQQKIVTIAANTAIGNLETLKTELIAGLESGLTVNEIKEVLVQMYAYAGFPRSLQGVNTFMTVLEDRKNRNIQDNPGREASSITDNRDKYAIGKENLEKLTGVHETTLSGANAFAPAIDVFLKEHLFADIFERDVLTYQQRELATIAALAAMQGVEPMLQSHMNMGLNVGLTEGQLGELVNIISATIGKEQGNVANDTLKKVLNSRK